MKINIEKKLSDEENKRILELFKRNKFNQEEIRIYCIGYSEGMLYLDKNKTFK